MSEQDDNFLSRWSRRKALVRQGVEPPPAAVPPVAAVPAAVVAAKPPAEAAEVLRGPDDASGNAQDPATPAVAAPPKLTLDDVEALTPESDFSRFITRDVDEKVKNSAMKKLFTDPHYNVMDGLDIYISDYNTPDPLPKAMLRQLVQARMLGLLDDDLPEQPAADEVAKAAPAPGGVAAEVEVEVEQAAEAANDDPQKAAANDDPEAALPALSGADADLPFTLPTDVMAPGPAHAEDAVAVAASDAAQPGPGSSSKAS